MLEDYQWIQDTNKAWRLAQKLASNDEMQTMQVYFLISGLVIDAATQGKTQPGPDVFLYTCTSAAIYAGDGIWAVYGFKYEVDDDKGIVFKQAGITMVQHLTSKTHQNQLHIFSAHITPHIAQFSAKIAVKQSGQVGEHALSIYSSSAGILSV